MSSISRAQNICNKTTDFLQIFDDCDFISDNQPDKWLRQKLVQSDKLRIKFGIDPTATELHLGWAVPLRRLKKAQELGHQIVLVVGDFTATIGDPSGKNKTRKQLTQDEVQHNIDNLLQQFNTILDMNDVEIYFNSTWWNSLSVFQFISMLSSITVSQLLERNDFNVRFKQHKPIALHELIYPILQARDSIFVNADIEIGGSDQRFNCMLGRDVMSSSGMNPQAIILCPLLLGLDGVSKMSQSLNNYISIRDEPSDMFGKVMSINDEMMAIWWNLLQLPNAHYLNQNINPKNIKKELANAIVTLCYDNSMAQQAQYDFESKYENKNWHDVAPDIILIHNEPMLKIVPLLIQAKFANTNSEAKRLIVSNAVELNDVKITDVTFEMETQRLHNQYIKVGKKKFGKIKVVSQ